MSSLRTTSIVRRIGVAALGGALLAAGLAAPVPARAATDTGPRSIGAGWLNGRLDDGLLHAAYDLGSGPVSYVDYGGTVEAAYALDAVDRTRRLPRITGALADTVDSYITGADFGEPDDHYAGPTGKLLAFASDLGVDVDPTAFGGTDLVARMESMVSESGRIADVDAVPQYCGPVDSPVPCDYANVFGQIWAARGLLSVDSAQAAPVVDFLVSQQCADGHFPTYFDSCNPAGPDATAFAVILLHDYAGSDPELAAALDKGIDWLLDWQGADGGLADDNAAVNANSTGLGGWAFDVAGRNRAAKKAAIWLRALQVPGRSCDHDLAGERGAIAYDQAAYRGGRNTGIFALVAGQWQTVAAQALPALTHAPAPTAALSVDAPEHVQVGTRERVTVTGLAAGERACVGTGRLRPVIGAPDGGPVSVRIQVGKPRGERTVKVQTADSVATDEVVAE